MTAGAAGSLRAAGQNRHAQWLTGLATSTFMFYVGLSTDSPTTARALRPVRRVHGVHAWSCRSPCSGASP